MKIHRAIPIAVLSIAGLVPLWRFEAHTATTTEAAAEVGVVPQAQTQTTSAPPAPGAQAPTAKAPATTAKTVNGKLVKTVHGDVQVQVTLTGDKITAVKFLKQPNTGPTKSAAPVLIQETLRAGTAKVDSVSGATQTSEAYVESLQAAIDAKGN
jgi:uncharacterized protein with FMN-binding domain